VIDFWRMYYLLLPLFIITHYYLLFQKEELMTRQPNYIDRQTDRQIDRQIDITN